MSAYHDDHSTETAFLEVIIDLFLSIMNGNISVVALLDFSSGFDHAIHTHIIHTEFGFTDTVYQCVFLPY